MAVSNRKDIDITQHSLYPHIQKAQECLSKNRLNKFNVILGQLHDIAGKVNHGDYIVNKNSKVATAIMQLFKDAKAKYPKAKYPDKEQLEQLSMIRMKQATFLEHMGDYDAALNIFDSLAKKATAPLRWAAVNSRTWLLRSRGCFQEALDSCNELLLAYETKPDGEKPSKRRYQDATKLAEGIERLMNNHVEQVALPTTPITLFGKPKTPVELSASDKPLPGISPLVHSLFQ